MATAPGIFYKGPWDYLGSYKHIVFLPLAVQAARVAIQGVSIRDNIYLLALIFAGFQYLYFQLWCTATRLPYVSGKYEIQTKGIKFEQVDHEATWDNYICMVAYSFWLFSLISPRWFLDIPVWNTKGILLAALIHAGPVEWIYYWAHRALHHHYLFRRYHSHHHSSFITEPITSVNHPFVELVFYGLLLATPVHIPIYFGCGSLALVFMYITFVDTMNAWGHCNFEFIPPRILQCFPIMKYLVYTPTYHSLHHSSVHTNFSLFMPIYDYLYGTVDKASDTLYTSIRKGRAKPIDCVYLSHGTDVLSTFHLQCGVRGFAAEPYSTRWYIWLLWPIAIPLLVLAWLFAKPFTSEIHRIGEKFEAQIWMLPRFKFQYSLKLEVMKIDGWIEDCIVKAQEAGAKVVALGLLNKNFKPPRVRFKAVKIPIVTGETLAAAILIHEIPEETKEVYIACLSSRSGIAVANYLCKRGTKVLVTSIAEHESALGKLLPECARNLKLVRGGEAVKQCKLWIVGDEGLSREEQSRPSPGTHFHQMALFPIRKWRKDCTYWSVPGLRFPRGVQNVHACEDVMPRYVARAGYAAAIVQALEEWQDDDFVDDISVESMDAFWAAALKHGFTPCPSTY